jgi:MoaA/NifB/PqqE/SkfB family radical SAM enzyme
VLNIHHHGFCYSCCINWNKLGSIGQKKDKNSIMSIWNSDSILYTRKAILDDELEKVCNFKNCPIAMRNQNMDLEELKNKKRDDVHFCHIIDQIMAGECKMDRLPYFVQISNFGKCNLKCVMCQVNDGILNTDQSANEKLFDRVLGEILPGISILSLSGSGEVLYNPYTRKFLQRFNGESYPSLRIELYTNGLLLTPKLWQTIKHNHYDTIYISCDAATKATYEKIRRNGNWDKLRQNLDFISGLRKKGVFLNFNICFIVMKSNYMEMKSFVELGIQLGCDRIIFQKISGYADIRENINVTRNKKIFKEIAHFLDDPIFTRPEVETTSIDIYKKYRNCKIRKTDSVITKLIELIFYLPIKTILTLNRYFPLLPYFYELFKTKKPKLRCTR